MLYCCGYKLDEIRPILVHYSTVTTLVHSTFVYVQTTDEQRTSVHTFIHCTFQHLCKARSVHRGPGTHFYTKYIDIKFH